MTEHEFVVLPLITEGESKIIRAHATDPGLCWIKLKPTIYSFTSNRAAWVEGSDKLRLEATRVFLRVLRDAGVDHAYVEVGDEFILSRLVREPPPIEVVVKAFHSGTSKHRYHGMGTTHKVRSNHPFYAGMGWGPDDGYPGPIVRFDWRNPMWNPEKVSMYRTFEVDVVLDEDGDPEIVRLPKEVYEWPANIRKIVMMADEVLGEAQADWFIDVAEARKTALKVYGVLNDFLGAKDIVLYDLCLFVTSDGKTVFGEISQDCGRFRHFDLGSLDKDVWRAGGSSADVLAKWAELLRIIS
jgi:phosphoribosylaminoimidazole-succinocarboxamide synthase